MNEMAPSVKPVSRATNAYELLDEIATLIVEEPRRYTQSNWKEIIEHVAPEWTPACQTVCCVAGWVDTLKNPQPISPRSITFADGSWEREEGSLGNVADSARSILGLTYRQAAQLFDGNAAGGRTDEWSFDEDDDDLIDDGEITSRSLREHAERGAAHVRRFMEANAAQLKAKRV